MTTFNVSRRSVLKGGSALFASSLLSSSALASIDPNSHSRRVFHATHYGPFEAIVRDGKISGMAPMIELDARPTEMLTYGVIDRTYDKTRVLYPMVRKSYLEGWESGEIRPELRGKEEFVRVDWDTALRLTSKAILDTIEHYGNEGIFSSSYGGWSHAGVMRPNVLQGRFFNLFGGCSMTAGDYSGGASQISLPHVIGDMEVYSAQTSWEVIRDETEIFLLVGCDPIKNNRVEFRVADHGMYAHWEEIRDNGVKFISINPQRTASDEFFDAEWLKIIPNTDVALFNAMSYHVVKKDLHDKAYLAKYAEGSDKFIDYLMGTDDGVEKSPEWASSITGISADKIRELAELFASKKVEIAGAWSLQRAHHGEMTHWAIINFAALTGKIGKPGQGVGFSWHYGNGGMPTSGKSTPSGLAQGRNLVSAICPASRISEMLKNPGKEFTHNGSVRTFPTVKMIYNAGNNFMSHQQDTNELINALQTVNTVVCQDPWWCASTRWSDIVLPASTSLERDDITSGGTYSNDRVYAMKKVIEPLGESLSDYEIFARLAENFVLDTQFTESLEYMEHIKAAYARSSATESFEEFWEKGYARMDVPVEARKWVRHGDFYEDPEGHPLHTTSGKVEMFCKSIAEMELDDCPGMPVWMEPAEYLGNAKEGQLHVVSPHPWYRLHSQMGNSERLRELYMVQGREPVRISAKDAEERGIADGDLVELYNDRGTVIAGAVVSDEIMPGVVSIYEGGWPQVDSKGRCNSGLINFVTSSRRSSGLSQATTANTCLVSLRKCEDPEGPNRAYEPPAILEDMTFSAVTEEAVNSDRIDGLVEALYADMSEGEKLFYQRCTVCHGPRDPSQFTQLQWKGITQSMFPRAGLEDTEKAQVLDFLLKNAKDAG
ncbi:MULTISPECIES: molybdopterin-dependent oxidoreductase [unclassified Pseudovibrio]|uniref:molybdopterin-dependent oxidoreductase n=1 Tax=unclassified Pseudovibrio TaxID=2627060 RepID=UPI0007AE7D7D|nr:MULTISPECIES: molybdopterin-dependent oxidoreductase [unclassified Pseudovibrio]KZL00306.1 Dimethyl sulfoxide/trimethylamine N-oxide reductase precursor [Pseudovibrio sp. W74]KZL07306.1 Dimethyl sulfoxide/trimethylamine N-oxide reductase precursor [Pseudovibrio sp. Ad14]